MGIGFRWGTVFESEGEIGMSCLEVLLKQSNVDDYEIESSLIQSIQHFYVLDRLETVRHGQTKDTFGQSIYGSRPKAWCFQLYTRSQ